MSIKTKNEIERDFFAFIKGSNLGRAIRGTLYRRTAERPSGAKQEDAVCVLLAGYDAQVQTGTMVLNIFVPDTPDTDGRLIPNLPRIGELEDMVQAFKEGDHGTEYDIRKEGATPTDTHLDEASESVIIARIEFRRIS